MLSNSFSKRPRSHAPHSIWAAKISPRRNHAATAPGWEAKLLDVRKAADSSGSQYDSRQLPTLETPKNRKQASTVSVVSLTGPTQPRSTISLTGTSFNQSALSGSEDALRSRSRSRRYLASLLLQKPSVDPSTVASSRATRH